MQIGIRTAAVLTMIVIAGVHLCGSRPAVAVEADQQVTQRAGAPMVLKNFTKKRKARSSTSAALSQTNAQAKATIKATTPNKSAMVKSAVSKASSSNAMPAGTSAPAITTKTTSATSKGDAAGAVLGTAAAADDDTVLLPALPPSVANANAQMAPAPPAASANAIRTQPAIGAPAESPGLSAAAAPAPANESLVSSDQLNDLDLAASDPSASETKAAPAQAMQTASIATPNDQPEPTAAKPETVRAQDDSAWGQTSLIGKIFIAFGGLLTLASAAWMFVG